MRENIGLFKAKRFIDYEEVQGFYWTNGVGNHFIRVIKDDFNNYVNPVDFEVNEQTLCECTGLYDKNGKLIFENDYVKQEVEIQGYSSGEPNDDLSFFGCIYGTVKFQPSAGFFIQVSGVEDYITGEKTKENWKTRKRIVSYRTEVIGNKFDNPELLEVRDE